MGFAERAPIRLAPLGTLRASFARLDPASGRGKAKRAFDDNYPLAAPTLENRRRMRINSPSQTSR